MKEGKRLYGNGQFFDDAATELVEKFCDYFELDKEEVLDYFINVDPETFVR